MSEQDDYRNDPYPDRYESTIGVFDIVLALAAMMTLLAIYWTWQSMENEPKEIDHCHPTNWQ